ncbi:flippase [Leuconostoc mesenteroides]|uniref:flippase n=1 Tax=Leuconostoc mesenteroides TaxID=1245 RepID=UPI000CF9F0F3|nr:flippase [Leuconostoc mesenteroides]QHM55603.1 Putative O-antigen transporter [Leuconostoc mesenteroides]SPE66523.1 Putative O-antigen transporter [Leuconostoc mesenteroides]
MQVAKNYLYTAAYQLLNIIAPLITMPYLARVLGRNGVGVASWTNSFVTYFLLIASLGIVTYGSREIAYVKDNKQARQQKFWEIQIIHTIAGIFSLALYFLFLKYGVQLNSNIEDNQIYLILQTWVIISGILDISWYFMGMEDFKKTVLRNALVKIAMTVLIFVLVKTPNDIGNYILLLGLSQVFGNLSMWFYLFKKISLPNWQQLDLKEHVKPIFMMFLPTIATQVYLQLNKTMLPFFTNSTDSAGFYDNADRIIKVSLALVTSVGTVMLPRMSAQFAKGQFDKMKQNITQSMDFVSALSVPMAFGMAAIAPTAMIWFLGEQFKVVGQVIVLLSPIIIFIGWSTVIGTQYLVPTKRLNEFTLSVTIGALANVLLNFWLIYVAGVNGAAVATTISEFLVIGYQLYVTRKDMNIWHHFSEMWRYIIAGLGMYVSVTMISQYLEINIKSTAIELLLGVFMYVLILIILRAPILKKIPLLNKIAK